MKSGLGKSIFQRKARKLIRSPRLFFSDFVKNRLGHKVTRAESGARVQLAGRKIVYSIVSAVYNVEPYLDDFFRSIVRQSLDFSRHIEIIIVDDGSTDNSAGIVERWRKKFPDNIRYFRKDNGGQGAARNFGMDFIRGEWVTFIDPDDFVSENYFLETHRAIASAQSRPAMVSCNFIYYYERKKKYSNTHPLRYRFAKGNRTSDFSQDTKDLQLSCATAFFDAQLLRMNGKLRIHERIRPNFEDANFVNRYLHAAPSKQVIFLASAEYYYRKRGDGSSTLDTAWEKPEVYGDVLEYGVLPLLQCHPEGAVPKYVQRVALYHLIWYFKHLLSKPAALSILDDSQRRNFWSLLNKIFCYIGQDTIVDFELGGAWFFHKVGLLHLFGKTKPDTQIVYLEHLDFDQELLQLRYFTGEVGFEAYLVDGREVAPTYVTTRRHVIDGHLFVNERIVWLALPREGAFCVSLNVPTVRLSLGATRKAALDCRDIYRFFEQQRSAQVSNLPWETRFIRWVARLNFVRRAYAGAWVLMDRDVKADDNAEHLYRHICNRKPSVRLFFMLRRSSPDWKRLREDGFNLVPFGGLRHRLLMLNCDHFISSHVDAYLTNLMDRRLYGDVLNYRFTFLQHGIIKDDLSRWLNTKEIDCFITASPREAESIAGPSRYKFSKREVVMTGLPRHDRLLSGDQTWERIILIMPTWRSGLMGPPVGKSNRRELNPAFRESEYFREWRALLHDKDMETMVKSAGYRVIFHPHQNVLPYIKDFELPSYVELFDQSVNDSIQNLFRHAGVLVTDYSSVAFEMAIAKKPVLYFQFDREAVFSGGHIYDPGYFSYEDDGFGPVCLDRATLVAQLGKLLALDAEMPNQYVARVEAFFGYVDTENCDRVIDAIEGIRRSAHLRPIDTDNALEQARFATEAKRWDFAELRWPVLRGVAPEAALELTRAKRHLGKYDEAMEIVQSYGNCFDLNWEIERAELLFAKGAWNDAAVLWTRLSAITRGGTEERLHEHMMLRRLTCYVRARELGAASWCLSLLPQELAKSERSAEARAIIAAANGAWTCAAAEFDQLEALLLGGLPLESCLDAAWSYYRANQIDKAARLITGLKEEYPHDVRVAYLEGRIAIAREDWKGLEASWPFESHPEHDEIWDSMLGLMNLNDLLEVARSWRMAGSPEKSVSILRRAGVTQNSEIATEYGECLAAAGEWNALAAHIDFALDGSDAEDRKLLQLLGARAHTELGNIDAARSIYSNLIESDGSFIAALFALGNLEYQYGELPAAVEAWLRVYRICRALPVRRDLPEELLPRLIASLYATHKNDVAMQLLSREAVLAEIDALDKSPTDFTAKKLAGLADLIRFSMEIAIPTDVTEFAKHHVAGRASDMFASMAH